MTGPTPQQYREMAGDVNNYAADMNIVAAYLRTAADQLEAVREWMESSDREPNWDALEAILADETTQPYRHATPAQETNMSEQQECICDWHMRMRDPNPDCRANHDDNPSPHPPTREQIAEAAMGRYPALNPDAEELTYPRSAIRNMTRGAFEAGAQYVLALIQNGADR